MRSLHSLSPSSVPPVPSSLPHSPSLIRPLPPKSSPSLLPGLQASRPPGARFLSSAPPPQGAPYPEVTCSQPFPGSPAAQEPFCLVSWFCICPQPFHPQVPRFLPHVAVGSWTNQLCFFLPLGLCTCCSLTSSALGFSPANVHIQTWKGGHSSCPSEVAEVNTGFRSLSPAVTPPGSDDSPADRWG